MKDGKIFDILMEEGAKLGELYTGYIIEVIYTTTEEEDENEIIIDGTEVKFYMEKIDFEKLERILQKLDTAIEHTNRKVRVYEIREITL